jgi:hypothetical protein
MLVHDIYAKSSRADEKQKFAFVSNEIYLTRVGTSYLTKTTNL